MPDRLPKLIEEMEQMLQRTERVRKLWMAVVTVTVGAVLWGARLEFASEDHGRRINGLEVDVKANGKNISEIQGRLHGIASQVGKVPGRVAGKLEDNNNMNPSNRP